MEWELTLRVAIQFVEIHYGGIGPGKAGMYDSQQILSIAMTYPNDSMDILIYYGFPGWVDAMPTRSSVGRHGQPCISGMASEETGSCDTSVIYCDILTIPMAIPIFSRVPSWMATLPTPTSFGRYGQPYISGTASMETESCDISHMGCDIFSIPTVILTFSGLPSWIETPLTPTSFSRHGQPHKS